MDTTFCTHTLWLRNGTINQGNISISMILKVQLFYLLYQVGIPQKVNIFFISHFTFNSILCLSSLCIAWDYFFWRENMKNKTTHFILWLSSFMALLSGWLHLLVYCAYVRGKVIKDFKQTVLLTRKATHTQKDALYFLFLRSLLFPEKLKWFCCWSLGGDRVFLR